MVAVCSRRALYLIRGKSLLTIGPKAGNEDTGRIIVPLQQLLMAAESDGRMAVKPGPWRLTEGGIDNSNTARLERQHAVRAKSVPELQANAEEINESLCQAHQKRVLQARNHAGDVLTES
jgi:hypothetical protein